MRALWKKKLVVSWRPPPEDWVKLNADGSFVNKDLGGGAGFVARDCNGYFLFAGATTARRRFSVFGDVWHPIRSYRGEKGWLAACHLGERLTLRSPPC